MITNKSGLLSIESRNIFSILKKWLYTEKDIVFRELVSNASDAIAKQAGISPKSDTAPAEPGRILVILDAENKQLIIRDNGIGMTYEEVDKYINQVAFSGAAEFINTRGDATADTIIGHFGVGFYSSFMISDHVSIETKSSLPGASALRWDCDANMAYRMQPCQKTDSGTDVILYLNDDNEYLQNPQLIYDILKKYFIFCATPIYFQAPGKEAVLISDTDPIWKRPKESINAAAMNTFYKSFFNDVSDPLFWLQFESVDIGIRGILFFRDTRKDSVDLDGSIKVYSRGVYVGENIKEIIPKFVNLQSGIIECDHLPLVVSRSQIREDGAQNEALSLIYESLTQEVTIAMHDMFENKRKELEAHWQSLNAFIKYAVLQDKIFASVMTNKVLFQDIRGTYLTIGEYVEQIAQMSHSDTVYYSSDAIEQAHYIEIFKKCDMNALLFDHVIDQPFLRKYEVVRPNLKFVRIDSNIGSLFEGYLEDGDDEKEKQLEDKILRALGERLGEISLKITNLALENISVLIINDEKSRRMTDMLEIYGFINPDDTSSRTMQSKSTLLINMNNDIIRFVIESKDEAAVGIVLNQLFDLALMSQQALRPEDIENFINRSESILASSLRR